MQNYVALYGFLRTSCLIAILAFWWTLYNHHWLTAAGSCAVAFLLYVGFIKFYRRFSLEAMMAVSVVVQSSSEAKPAA
jgi:hypothetical protein